MIARFDPVVSTLLKSFRPQPSCPSHATTPMPLLLGVKPTGKSLLRKEVVQRVAGLEVTPSTEGHGPHGVAFSVTPAI